MKKIIFASFVAVGSLTALCGCGDSFLNADNKASIEAETYFSTEEGQTALRVNMYSGLKPMVNDVNLTEWGTDLYITTQTATPGDFQTYALASDNGSVQSYYTSVYSMINTANCMLKYGAGNAQYVAEAKFIRCLGYYWLTQQFGAVPVVTEYIETANRNYPRTPLKEVYDWVIAELESIAGEASLPETSVKGEVSRRAVKALLAKVCLAAGWDLETTLGNDLQGTYTIGGTAYFSKAAQYAADAIVGQQLTMSFEDKWSPFHEGNEEEIFSVQYDRAAYPGDVLTGGHGRQNTYGSQLGDPATTGLKTCSGVLAASPKSIYLYDKGDERFEATFMTTVYGYTGAYPATGYYAYYHAKDADKAKMTISDKYLPWYTTTDEAEQYIKEHKSQLVQGNCPTTIHVHIMADPASIYYFNADGSINRTTSKVNQSYLDVVRANTASVYCVKKFDDASTEQINCSTNDYRDIPVLHLSDIYLVAAEAYLMMGQEEQSLAYLNAVRRRAKASALDSYADYRPNYEVSTSFGAIRPIDVVLDERARELYAETTRWTDLRRTRQLVKYNVEWNSSVNSVSDMSDAYGQVKWYRPIPVAEINTNDSMTDADQNPGY